MGFLVLSKAVPEPQAGRSYAQADGLGVFSIVGLSFSGYFPLHQRTIGKLQASGWKRRNKKEEALADTSSRSVLSSFPNVPDVLFISGTLEKISGSYRYASLFLLKTNSLSRRRAVAPA